MRPPRTSTRPRPARARPATMRIRPRPATSPMAPSYRRSRRCGIIAAMRLLPACLLLALVGAAPAPPGAPVTVVIATDLGEIEAQVDAAHAPVTAANFLRYVDAGHYVGGRFHRTVRLDNQPGKAREVLIEVVQAGADPARESQAFPPVTLERTSVTGLLHRDGTLSMARDGPDTATSDFF